jgi:hypothetical protein
MAGKLLSLNTGAVTGGIALVAATAKTIVQLDTSTTTNDPTVELTELIVSFNGTSSIAQPVEVMLVRQTGGSGTGTTNAPVLVKGRSDTILTTGKRDFSAEPTNGNVLEVFFVHPQGGFPKIYPLNMEVDVGAGDAIGVVCKAPAIVNVHVTLKYRE